MLTHQSVRHPLINRFISILFYNENTKDGLNIISLEYNEEIKSLGLPAVCFLDVPSVESKSTRSGKGYINIAAIVMLLRQLRIGISVLIFSIIFLF